MFRHLLGHDRKLRSLRHGVRRPSYQRSCQPQLERLEDRLAPATHFWSGEGDPGQQHKWSNDDNWDNGAPGGDSDAVLDYPSDVRISLGSSSDDYPGEISIRSIVFHRAGYFVGNAAGSSAYLIDNIGALNEDGNNVFNLDMRLPDGQHVFEVDGNSGSLELSGRLTGGGEISKEGEGTLILDGDARAYYGLIVVNNGGVQLSSPGVLSSDNTISVREQGALELTSGDFTLRHLGEVRGGVYLSQGASLTLEGGMTHFYKGLSGDDADRGLNLTGNARVTLDAYNPFEGPVRISSGTLQMDGTLNPHAMHSPWTVDQGGRLTGRGEVPDVLVSGSVIPGDPPEESGSAPGVLYTKNVSFLPGSSFAVRLNGYEQGGIHGYDQLRVLGRVDLSGSPKLDASVGFASKPGDTFPILTSTDGITGTFAGLPDGTNFGIDGTPMQIHYTATSVVLTHRPQFAPPVTYAAGRYPILVATGDLRGNGIKDLVTASAYDGTVSVLLGNGDGTFQAAVTYPASQLSTSLIVGDFNGDGNLDLVTVGYPAGVPTVSVLLGNGDGTFQAAVPSPLDRRAAAAAAGDLNGDGMLDLVTANEDTVSVLLGNGDGTFQTAVTYPVGRGPGAVAMADFNGDGTLDLVTANFSTISVLLGNGDGTFQPAMDFPGIYGGFTSIAVGDFRGNGMLDLIATANSSFASAVVVLLGNGDGTFADPKTAFVGDQPGNVAVRDFDGDGKLDFVVTTGYGSYRGMALVYGRGDGTFAAPSYYYLTPGLFSLAVDSFQGTRFPDVAVINDAVVSVLLNVGDGGVPPPGGSAGRQGPTLAPALFPSDGLLRMAGVEAALRAWPSALGTLAGAPSVSPTPTLRLEVTSLERFFAAATERGHGFAWSRSEREALLGTNVAWVDEAGKGGVLVDRLAELPDSIGVTLESWREAR